MKTLRSKPYPLSTIGIFARTVLMVSVLCIVGCQVNRLAKSSDTQTGLDRNIQSSQPGLAWRLAKKLDSPDSYFYFLQNYRPGKRYEKAAASMIDYHAAAMAELEWVNNNEPYLSGPFTYRYKEMFAGQLAVVPEKDEYGAKYYLPDDDGDRSLDALAAYLKKYPEGVFSGSAKRWFAEALVMDMDDNWYDRCFDHTGESWAARDNMDLRMQCAQSVIAGYGFTNRVGMALEKEMQAIQMEIEELPQPVPMIVDTRGVMLDSDVDGVVDGLDMEPYVHAEYAVDGNAVAAFEPGYDERAYFDGLLQNRPADMSEAEYLAQIAECQENNLQGGLLTFDTLPEFYVGVPVTYKLTIEQDTDCAKMSLAVSQGRTRFVRQITISREMQVHILPENPAAFTIDYYNCDSVQLIHPNIATTWRWRIIPHEPGLQKVIVSADIITRSDLSDELRKTNFTIFEEVVEVKVKEKPEEELGTVPVPLMPGITTWLPWLLIPLLLGAIAWFFIKKKKQREEPAAAANVYHLNMPARQALPVIEVAENLLAEAETGEALQRLLDAFQDEPDPLKADLINLNAQYNLYERETNNGLSPDRAILNRITFSLANILGQLKDGMEVPAEI